MGQAAITVMEGIMEEAGRTVTGGTVCIRAANSRRRTSNLSLWRCWQTGTRTATN